MPRKLHIGADPTWTSAPVLDFTTGTGSSVNLATYVNNPRNYAVTFSVDSGVAPNGLSLSGNNADWSSGGTGPVGTYSLAFLVTSSRGYKVSPTSTCTIRPAVPTVIAVSNPTTNSLTISWSAVSGATYKLYRVGTADPIYSGSATTYTNTGLATSTTYSYTVSAVVNSVESAQSAAVNGTTSWVTGSATIAWGAPTTNSAGLSFDGSSNDRKIAAYRVYYGTSQSAVNGRTSAYQSVNGVAAPYAPPLTTTTITGLAAGTWYFRVTALDADGDESDVDATNPIGTKVIA